MGGFCEQVEKISTTFGRSFHTLEDKVKVAKNNMRKLGDTDSLLTCPFVPYTVLPNGLICYYCNDIYQSIVDKIRVNNGRSVMASFCEKHYEEFKKMDEFELEMLMWSDGNRRYELTIKARF